MQKVTIHAPEGLFVDNPAIGIEAVAIPTEYLGVPMEDPGIYAQDCALFEMATPD